MNPAKLHLETQQDFARIENRLRSTAQIILIEITQHSVTVTLRNAKGHIFIGKATDLIKAFCAAITSFEAAMK